jgi:hypothetical protein
MPEKKHWIIIPISIIGSLLLVVLAALYVLNRSDAWRPNRPNKSKPDSRLKHGGKHGDTLERINKLPLGSHDREPLLAIANKIRSLSSGDNGDLLDLQHYQDQISRLALQLEELDDDIFDHDNLDLVDELKVEVSAKREEGWKRQLTSINSRIAKLPQVGHVLEEVELLGRSIAQLDNAAQEVGGDKAKDLQNSLEKLSTRLQEYRPNIRQVAVMIPGASQAPGPLLSLFGAITALILSLVAVALSVKGIRDLRNRLPQDTSLKSDFYTLKDNFQREIQRFDRFDKNLEELLRMMKTQGTGGSRRQQIDVQSNRPQAPWDYREPVAPPPQISAIPPPPLPSLSPCGFIGRITDLLPLIPLPNKVMQYDPVLSLLLEGNRTPGPKCRVFQDPTTQEFRAIPTIERAAVQDLYTLESVFDLDGAGFGAVSLVRHPQLESSESGYRVVTKGLLRVG